MGFLNAVAAKVSTKATNVVKAAVSSMAASVSAWVKKNTPAKPAASTTPSKSAGGGSGSKTSGSGSSGAAASEAALAANALIQWYDVPFYANANEVRGFTEFSISGSVETEEKESDGTKYVSKKNSKGYEVGITAFFDRRLGIKDVKEEAMRLTYHAATGQTGYLYAQGRKLVTSALMLTNANVSNVIMSPNGTWISCEVAMTLKTSGKLDGTAVKTGGGGYKYSVTVYYSGSSGAVQSVTGYSNISVADARTKAWAKVPKTAMWASETKKQATNQGPKLTEAALEAARKRTQIAAQQAEAAKAEAAKTETPKIGIIERMNQVLQKKMVKVK